MPKITVKTELSEDFKILQTISSDDPVSTFTARLVDVAALQLENAIRTQLVRLGWTPPPEAS